MTTNCPNCGAPIEFRYDDSFVRVCGSCNHAVARTDRGIETLGKVADLVPIDSPLKLFAEGKWGGGTFLLVGMAQIRHGAGGMWQEWYAKLDGGKWGWLAEAQGRYYLTFEIPGAELPDAPGLLRPGQVVSLPVDGVMHSFTVSEDSRGSYVAAAGELPYKLIPEGSFGFCDLDDGHGNFATIDFGEGDAPTLYVGRQVTLAELGISGGEVGPSRDEKITSKRLACPNCNGSIDLRAPDSQRVVCPYCNQMISLEGELRLLGPLATKAKPAIPLGSTATFEGVQQTVIGYVQRSAQVEGDWYPFYEYLLYEPSLGFRWLVSSDGHWSYVQPVAGGAVEMTGTNYRYDGVVFKRFASTLLRVDEVLGEFYWRVEAGETVNGEDYIAPPAMLSRELSANEETWSLSTYQTIAEVEAALGQKGVLFGLRAAAGANQVNRSERVANRLLWGAIGILAVGAFMAATAPNKLVWKTTTSVGETIAPGAAPSEAPCVVYARAYQAVATCDEIPATARAALTAAPSTDLDCNAGLDTIKQMIAGTKCTLPGPPAAGVEQQGNVVFSDPFELDGSHNVEVSFHAPVDNNWVYAEADLVNQDSGQVIGMDATSEHWSGVDDGESWSEGSRTASQIVGPQPAGTYLLRVEAQQGGHVPTQLDVAVRQGVFRTVYLIWALVIIGVPLLAFGLAGWSFEKRRWENSTSGQAPKSFTLSFTMWILGAVALWLAWKVIDAMGGC